MRGHRGGSGVAETQAQARRGDFLEDGHPSQGVRAHDRLIQEWLNPITKARGEGTGLGLSIVHKIISEFEGSIDFASVPGSTVFTVILPLEAKPA
jgi:nitrogen-specific signal transduction histidine kinase